MRNNKKNRWVGVVVILVLSACVKTQPSVQEPYQPVTLRINYAVVTSYAPIIIVEAEGYFAEYGTDLEKDSFNNSVESIPLVVSVEKDICVGATSAGIINVLGKEENIKVVADNGHIFPEGCTFQAIVVRKDLVDSGEITAGEDLAGYVVSTPPTGPGIYFLSNYLQQNELTIEDATITDIRTASFNDALKNKLVDAIIPTELHFNRIMASGEAEILASSENVVEYYQTSVLAFRKSLLIDDPDVGVRFMAAYLKGVKKYNEGKTERNLLTLADCHG